VAERYVLDTSAIIESSGSQVEECNARIAAEIAIEGDEPAVARRGEGREVSTRDRERIVAVNCLRKNIEHVRGGRKEDSEDLILRDL